MVPRYFLYPKIVLSRLYFHITFKKIVKYKEIRNGTITLSFRNDRKVYNFSFGNVAFKFSSGSRSNSVNTPSPKSAR